MLVKRIRNEVGTLSAFELLDDQGQPIENANGFLHYLAATGASPHTLSAYAYDLLHFFRFLNTQNLSFEEFSPPHSLLLLGYLRELPAKRPARRLGLSVCTTDPATGASTTKLAPASINRIFAAVSAFYDYLNLAGLLPFQPGEANQPMLLPPANPIVKVADLASSKVADRHRPFMGRVSFQQPLQRSVRVKTALRLPRPLPDEQVKLLLEDLATWRDRAMILLMLQGGLRPGEVLNLHLEDIQYGRRRVVIRYRTDHPAGARTKSRTERLVDLHEPQTLEALSNYVMRERPRNVAPDNTFVFLVGGNGKRHDQPLSYHALVKLFARHCEKLSIRSPWVTPHALRHTHATRMWESGMRELALQKRLGHASPNSTRLYTRVSDPQMVEEYRRALAQKPDCTVQIEEIEEGQP
ncbi:MAG TPA: tyrosine-type recombinase/integrase [Chloroflexia bacterium]|nr:tyrosine-type recombinase/integrase [Chloroflexia bacterium]